MTQPVVLVTGAAKRVGRTIATYFGRRGYRVAVHFGGSADEAQQTVRELAAMNARAYAIQADLGDARQIEELVDRTYNHFGQLNVLINCASVFVDDHLEDFDLAAFDHAWAVNGRAPLLLTRAFHARESRRLAEAASTSTTSTASTRGVVINIVDQKVLGNFHRDHFSYTVGKTAIGHLTTMLAKSAAPVLRVNAVYPGLMLPSGDQTEADFHYAAKRSTPLGKVAGPEDLAAAVFLVCGEAYNGVDWVVDAGQNLIPVNRDVVFEHRDPTGECDQARRL